MRIAITHHTTRAKARQIIEKKMSQVEQHYGHYASDVEQQWNGDVLNISAKAKGFSIKGTLEITDTEVILEGKLPLMAKMFEGRIKSTVEKEGTELFPSRTA
jgi:putative polyhydroxyalkanoate system protein